MNTLTHYIYPSIVSARGPVDIVLVGAGGTGGQVLSGLARMNQALKALGSPGLHLRVLDGDSVSASNVGRQLFSPADIGKNKAVVLVTRLNLFFGTNWEAYPWNVARGLRLPSGGIVISAVDDVNARYVARDIGKDSGMIYWLDTGNTASTGQVVLGTFGKVDQPVKSCAPYLPHVLDLYQGIMEDESRKPYQGPSCSLQEALARQDLFINQWVATCGMEIIWRMFRQGQVKVHGAFVNLNTMTVRPLPVNPEVWESMGWKVPKRKREADRKAA
ncbi:MAG: ThiF family protein [Syntrophorhabdaceae bacterium PtaU1.Bin034]|nr:MAG: ThiF family protein [Syntrophorhabdaceae bacterium PtaU1.Bin034]